MTATVEVEPHFYKDAKPDWHQLRRRKAIMALFEGLKGRVLDYGCGWGDLAHQISKRDGIDEVIGVDVDEDRVNFANSEYKPLQFKVCPSGEVDYPDASFDVVCSSVVIHFVPDPKAYLDEVHRVLKAGGRAVIMTRGEEKFRNALRRAAGRPRLGEGGELYCPTAAQFEVALADSGFNIERRNFFYDPPFDGWNTPRATFVGIVEQVCSLFRIRSTAQYLGYLVSKR